MGERGYVEKALEEREYVSVNMIARETKLSVKEGKKLIWSLKELPGVQLVYFQCVGNCLELSIGMAPSEDSVIGILKGDGGKNLLYIECSSRPQGCTGGLEYPKGGIQPFFQSKRSFDSEIIEKSPFVQPFSKLQTRPVEEQVKEVPKKDIRDAFKQMSIVSKGNEKTVKFDVEKSPISTQKRVSTPYPLKSKPKLDDVSEILKNSSLYSVEEDNDDFSPYTTVPLKRKQTGTKNNPKIKQTTLAVPTEIKVVRVEKRTEPRHYINEKGCYVSEDIEIEEKVERIIVPYAQETLIGNCKGLQTGINSFFK